MNIFIECFSFLFVACLADGKASAQSFVEEFDYFDSLWTHGWDSINHSTYPAYHPCAVAHQSWCLTNWGTCMDSPPGTNMAITTNDNAIVSHIGGILNVWLIAPVCTFRNGDQVYFYTASADSCEIVHQPDRMQVRLSTNGASSDVGQADTSVGDFSNLLMDINPTYSDSSYPVGYPQRKTLLSITLNGLVGPTPGRFAFRYFVENAWQPNAYKINIDSVAYVSILGVGEKEETAPDATVIYPNPAEEKMSVLGFELNGNATGEVDNMLGEKVRELQLEFRNNKSEVDVSQLKPGVYTLRLSTDKKVIVKKFVKR